VTARRRSPQLTYATRLEDAYESADLVMVLTEWSEFLALDPAAVGGKVRALNVIDGRNALDPVAWRSAGWSYRGLGRP
jgi:UDPglucose 6-dehydrogenase